MFKIILVIVIGWVLIRFFKRNRWWFSVRKFKSTPVSNSEGCVLFTGSSSIRFWSSLQRDMAPIPVVNRGFGGSTFADLVRFVDYVFYGIKPRAVVVYSGENDVAWSRRDNTQKVLQDLRTFVDLVQTKYGSPPIFLISQKLPPFHRKRWDRLRRVNELIRNFAVSRSGVTFIDITDAMFDASGEPLRELYGPDGIHMSAKGYAVWTSIIRPYLEGPTT